MEFAKWQIKIKEHDFGHCTLKIKCTWWAIGEVISLLSSWSTRNFPNK